MDIRLLGRVEVCTPDGALYLGPTQQRTVLAALAVDAGRTVTVRTLVDRVWGGEPPGRPEHALQVHISRLRGLLADHSVALQHRGGGYQLDVAAECVDILRFRCLVQEATAGPHEQRGALLHDALALWRGVPLADITGEWADRARRAWIQQRLDAAAAWAEFSLREQRPEIVVGSLADLVAEFPAAENLVALLMRALLAVGRPADALEYHQTTVRFLVDEFGADPGPELTAAHRAVLSRSTVDGFEVPPPAVSTAPAQLPFDVAGFSGRRRELAVLHQLVTPDENGAETARMCIVTGMAGVGKTTLTVHWGHCVADQFPDGQLYLDLRGFDPVGQPMAVEEALRYLLVSLGVPGDHVPSDPSAQRGLYRTTTAGRRLLLLLDNACDGEQVRDLLPGSAHAVVVVTSRRQLTGLISATGARAVLLAPMPDDEATELLARRVGVDRIAAEPDAVATLLGLCGCLPLALSILAARAAVTEFELGRLAEEVRGGFEAYAEDDPASDLRAVFSWSYRVLAPEPARLFRLLGLHPGPTVGLRAIAALAGCTIADTRTPLAELLRANLVIEAEPGRYSLHDLLRGYAAELAGDAPAQDSAASRLRMIEYYLHWATAADNVLDPTRGRRTLPAPSFPIATEVANVTQALAWFTAERMVLVTIIRQLVTSNLDEHGWLLTRAVDTFLERVGQWQEYRDTQQIALELARRQGNADYEASTASNLGRAHAFRGEYDEARAYLTDGLVAFRLTGDVRSEANTYLGLGWIYERQGEHDRALEHARKSLALFQSINFAPGQANALNNLGSHNARIGRYAEALEYGQRALCLHLQTGDRRGQADTLDTLGYAHHQLREYAQAEQRYGEALVLLREIGNRHGEAETLHHLGDLHADAGSPESAAQRWREALEIYEILDHPDAATVRARLAG
jgi:DNA-binding SARP family transcriptional activator/tetratricopeptide (TPR) repeat protein